MTTPENFGDPDMIHDIATFCYSAFLIFALISPFLPAFLMWRLAGLSATAYIAGKLLEGPVHWSDQNFGYTIGTAIIVLFTFVIALAILIRLAVSAIRKTLNVNNLAGPKNRFMDCFDIAALAAVGCCIGLALAISLAFMLSGVSAGVKLDIGIAILASSAAAVILAISRRKLAITLAVSFVALAVAATMGAQQPNRILTAAEALAEGEAWCLTASDRSGPVSEIQQLGFFALPKGHTYPNLGLLKRVDNQSSLTAHWSIRRQEFVKNVKATWGVPTCYPIQNFAEAIKIGEVENTIYGVGPDVYSIGPELHPSAYTDRLSIRSNKLIGSDGTYSSITETMELIYNPLQPDVFEDAISLEMMPDPDELKADDLMGRNRMIVDGFDENTEQRLILYCLSGPYTDQVCRAQVFEGSLGYSFYLPLGEIDQWREAAGHVKALFASLRINSRQ